LTSAGKRGNSCCQAGNPVASNSITFIVGISQRPDTAGLSPDIRRYPQPLTADLERKQCVGDIEVGNLRRTRGMFADAVAASIASRVAHRREAIQ